jgi:putative nucleotidyltransferase with HDIG domain
LDSFKVPLRDAQGKMIGIIGGSHDITERKLNELMLKERTVALEQSLLRLQKAWRQTIEALASTSEAKDPYTAGHQKRVMQLAVSIGRELEMSEDDLTGLQMAAMIHDIGKINVPGELLSKPGLLSPLERQLINTHATAGYAILKELDLPWDVAQVVKQHHERCDGSGFPDGLKKDQINFSARILAVADVVEAMASHRPYRPALGIERALAEIEQGAGTLYDEAVAAVCLKLFRNQGFAFE